MATRVTNDGVWRGTTAGERRAQRRARLVEVAYELLGGEGVGATSVREVCRRAELNPRYFYESFADLDELLVAVLDEIVAEASAGMIAAITAAPPDARAKARAAIAAFVEFVTDDPRRARICFLEAVGNERLMRRRLQVVRTMAGLIASMGAAFYGVPADSDPIADIAAYALAGAITELLLTWLDGTLEVSRDQLVDDFTELFVATGETAAAIARGRA